MNVAAEPAITALRRLMQRAQELGVKTDGESVLATIESSRSDLREAERQLTRAQIAEARRVHAGSRPTNSVEHTRVEVQRFRDCSQGLVGLAAQVLHHDAAAALAKVERDHARRAEELPELRRRANAGRGIVPGTGAAFAAGLRQQRQEQQDDFAVFEEAHHAQLADASRIEGLQALLGEIRDSFADAFEQ